MITEMPVRESLLVIPNSACSYESTPVRSLPTEGSRHGKLLMTAAVPPYCAWHKQAANICHSGNGKLVGLQDAYFGG